MAHAKLHGQGTGLERAVAMGWGGGLSISQEGSNRHDPLDPDLVEKTEIPDEHVMTRIANRPTVPFFSF